MHVDLGNDNLLYELAQALAASNDHATAIALRKLAQAGYTTLEQVDGISDWILLSIPGVGVKRLGAVRGLTRLDWHPPSPLAIETTGWFLSAAQFALRFWPSATLASVVRGFGKAIPIGRPAEKRLAMDVFSKAACKALCYCGAEELLQLLQLAESGSWPGARPGASAPGGGQGGKNGRGRASPTSPSRTPSPKGKKPRGSDHYAYSYHERCEIVRHYRAARRNGEVLNKDRWAQAHYNIRGKTLLNYEREFPEMEQDA